MANNLGVDPDEWFRESIPMNEHPPHSDEFHTPLPTGDYITDENAPCDVEYDEETNQPVGISPPAPDKLGKDDWFENPLDSMPIAKDEGTMHEKMYQIATAKYNPFAVGGSENIGGSENMLDK